MNTLICNGIQQKIQEHEQDIVRFEEKLNNKQQKIDGQEEIISKSVSIDAERLFVASKK